MGEPQEVWGTGVPSGVQGRPQTPYRGCHMVVTAGLAESNGSLLPGFASVTCGLAAEDRVKLRNLTLDVENGEWKHIYHLSPFVASHRSEPKLACTPVIKAYSCNTFLRN